MSTLGIPLCASERIDEWWKLMGDTVLESALDWVNKGCFHNKWIKRDKLSGMHKDLKRNIKRAPVFLFLSSYILSA